MNRKTYIDNDSYTAGITVKDLHTNSHNNLALHAGSERAHSLANREALLASLGYTLDDLVCANQTHSNHFREVTRADGGKGVRTTEDAIPDTDALYTREAGLVLGSFTADCVPVTFYHVTEGLAGTVHSGWQGTVKELVPRMLVHLTGSEGCAPEGFRVQIGMALSQEKFEVDEDVYLKFKALGYADPFIEFNEATGKYHIDNQLTVKTQLERAGVLPEYIEIDRSCTYMSPDGFSYREDKQCGRHMAYIVKK
ncbi:polyphenol oxidase family protein [Planococcus sp. ISL-109]|uniref:polyphenol oxidase family protein n=1 Tax=Planococcus sp. ISL-109 TaxID=2819166 RepID=UPI001BE7049A|nr:polyphenol oxidase family protein [Planococcus sp. ISL-109]MBT2583319.1 laccase domain-containing protein [Planococcus sp. ISL-109]